MKLKNEVTIGQALDAMIVELKLKDKLDESRIKQLWVDLMGKPIAKYTGAITLKNGKLFIKVDAPALKQELSYSRDKIKELFNKELGNNIINEVLIF
jgi:hypothetical protein